MKKFFGTKKDNKFTFENEELAHFNVLRCKLGEQIICLCDDGFDYVCEVGEISKKMAVASIIEKFPNTKNPKINITIFQGLVKGEKSDFIVQKLTELGVSDLYLFESEFAIAKSNDNKLERLNKISKEACKQCGRSMPLNINKTIKFDEMLSKLKGYDLILFANEKNTDRAIENIQKKQNIAIIIGSEGGFSDAEICKIYSQGAINFGLGARILRAETACIACASIVGYMVGV